MAGCLVGLASLAGCLGRPGWVAGLADWLALKASGPKYYSKQGECFLFRHPNDLLSLEFVHWICVMILMICGMLLERFEEVWGGVVGAGRRPGPGRGPRCDFEGFLV